MGDSLKLLLVDDDEIDRNVFKRYLNAFPGNEFSILEFETGMAGLEYCNQQKPDCMLLDYSLPDLNGLDLISKIQDPSFPILILTGKGDESIAVEAMKIGAQDYLVKDNLTPTYLMSAINSAIKISKAERERKQAEEALVKANEELERRVKERTSSLEEAIRENKNAREIAESANRAKSIFLSKVSHELRTPMHSILGFTQLLLMDKKNPLADYQFENIKIVNEAGNHLLDLINEILDLSKIESGNNDLELSVNDIVPIVGNVVSNFKPLCDEKGIHLDEEELKGKSCFVKIDPLRFKQILFNLLSNAIKYNKHNGSVTVSLENLEAGVVRIGIQDEGAGISPENKDKIFQPFERLDVSPNKIEGSGIGLTITRNYVELMGGKINFESKEGEGSYFYVDFPVLNSGDDK